MSEQEEAATRDEAAVKARKEAPYYCPGCGRPYAYPAECRGTDEAPHPSIQTVDTSELDGDEHTPAPATGD